MAEIPENQSERRGQLLGMLRHLRRRSPRIVEGGSRFSEKAEQIRHGILLVITIILLIPVIVLVVLASIYLVKIIIELFSKVM